MLLMHVVPLLHVFITLMVLPTRHVKVFSRYQYGDGYSCKEIDKCISGGSAAVLCRVDKNYVIECWV